MVIYKLQLMQAFFRFFTLLTVLSIFAACGAKKDNSKILIGIGPSTDAERTNQRIEVITEYFKKQLGVDVGHVLVSNTNAMIEAMRANKIHVGSGGPFTYLVAADKAGAEAIVSTRTPDGHTDYYRSLLIARRDLPVNNLQDLKKHSKDITLSWAYPTSCSGHLVPRYYLQKEGIHQEDFKEIFTSTDHTSAIYTVKSGKVDVAAVYKSGVNKFVENGQLKEEDFKVIWESESLLASPVFVRGDLPNSLKNKIQQAYLNMKENSPKTWKVLRGQYTFEVEYYKVEDKDFDHYRKMANEIEDLGFDFDLTK